MLLDLAIDLSIAKTNSLHKVRTYMAHCLTNLYAPTLDQHVKFIIMFGIKLT